MTKKQFYIGISLIWLCAALSYFDLTPFAFAAAFTAFAYFMCNMLIAIIESEDKRK